MHRRRHLIAIAVAWVAMGNAYAQNETVAPPATPTEAVTPAPESTPATATPATAATPSPTASAELAPPDTSAVSQVGSDAPVLYLPAINSTNVKKLFQDATFNLDRVCGLYPDQRARICMVQFVTEADVPDALRVAKALHKKYAEKESWMPVVVVVGPADATTIANQSKKLPFPVLHDQEQIATQHWSIKSLPMFFAVNTKGTILVQSPTQFLGEAKPGEALKAIFAKQGEALEQQ